MYHEHGFRGRIGWHYYNEPLMAEKRLWRLMDAIDAEVPEAEYTLWTNGTKWPKEPENLERFAELHLTDYRLPKFPVDTRAWRKANRKTQVHHWQLDERLRVLGVTDTRPCRRMYTEFICDFYGNVHLCCYDWRGLASPGNVQTDPLPELIAKWQAVRTRIGGVTMDEESPEACLRCDLRSDYIPDFVPEIARDARCQ